jgi:hypothetical protein
MIETLEQEGQQNLSENTNPISENNEQPSIAAVQETKNDESSRQAVKQEIKFELKEISGNGGDYPERMKFIINSDNNLVGYVDEENSIWQKDYNIFKGRSIGKIKGNYREEAIKFYISRFSELTQKYEKMLEEIKSGDLKANFNHRLKETIEFLAVADALGDFDKLNANFKSLESESSKIYEKNYQLKEELCKKAEELINSTEWKETTEKLKKLQEDWKLIGPVLAEQSDPIWNRFRGALDKFFENLKNHYDEVEKDRLENLKKKEEFCVKAEELINVTDFKAANEEVKKLQEDWKTIGPVPILDSDKVWNRFRSALDKFYDKLRTHYEALDKERDENYLKKEELCKLADSYIESTDWTKTSEELKKLQEQWKNIGPVPMAKSEEIWNRFRASLDKFYERMRAHFEELDNGRKSNLERKEQLCLQAEALNKSTEWNETTETLIKLQEEWKSIGPVPKDQSEAIWNKFRGAMDQFFERKREFFVQKRKATKEKQEAWKNRLKETLQRKREQLTRLKESINRDEQNISRWQTRISDVLLEEDVEKLKINFESKITDTEGSLKAKLEKVAELEESIRDIESKL